MAVRTTEKLMCKLTQEEIDERSVRAAELDQQKRKLAEEKKGQVKIFNEQLKHLDKQIAELTEQATKGEELREVECEERPVLVNGANAVEVWRLDTNEPLLDEHGKPVVHFEDPEDDAPSDQPTLPFAAPGVPVLRCSAIDIDGEVWPITVEQADAFDASETKPVLLQCANGGLVNAVRILRGKACDTCGIVAPHHRPECASMRADAEIAEEGIVNGRPLAEVAEECRDALEGDPDSYDPNDTAQVAARIAAGEAPPDGPVRGVESATTKVKPKRGKRGAQTSEVH